MPYKYKLILSIIISIIVAIGSLSIGRYYIPINDVIHTLLYAAGFSSAPVEPSTYSVLIDIRLPRIIGAVLVGTALALSGVVYQSVFRNDLVSPDLLGVSHGASVGACVAILMHVSTWSTSISAFLGGIIAVIITLTIPKIMKNSSRLILILSGIIVSGFMAAIIGLIKYMADPDTELADIVYWQLGSLAKINWTLLEYISGIIIVVTIIIVAMRWRFNILSLPDMEARSLGVNIKKERLFTIALGTLLTASAVCLSGTIGWVGLIIPHICRIIESNNNATIIPLAICLSSTFLICADTLARSISVAEIPLGILCGFIGTPFFIFILYQRRRFF